MKTDKNAWVLRSDLKCWWYPPQTSEILNKKPSSPDQFMMQPLFLWMPYRMWGVKFKCIIKSCKETMLQACGLYKTVRQILDIDSYFYMATEYLYCKKCNKKYAAWNYVLIEQLSVGYQREFPAVLTYR